MNTGKLETTLAYQLWEAYSSLLDYMARHSDSPLNNLGLTQWQALNLINDNPGCSQSAVAVELGITRASVSAIITALVKKDLVERTAADKGNVNCLSMTAGGLKEINNFHKELDRMDLAVQRKLGKENATATIAALRELRALFSGEK
jgi:DNA-binding MarR family transcriptional regulator